MFGRSKTERIVERVTERLVSSLSDVLQDTLSEVLAATSKPRHPVLKRGAVALGGLAALTAGSAGISTIRRNQDAAQRS